MAIEIERKFLIDQDKWQPRGEGIRIRQGYLCLDLDRTVRVRTKGRHGYITVKGRSQGISRVELEYEIPMSEAEQMLDQLCHRPLIEKNRHVEVHNGRQWEIDVFFGENQGLIIAEIELNSEEERLNLPDWIREEVSQDARYFNSSLIKKPYSEWE